MSDNKKTFHEWALESILFKGRQDWYFCFLKSERIAHVLALLSEKVTHKDKQWFLALVDEAGIVPETTAHFVAGEANIEVLLADIFSLISKVRLSGTRGFLSLDTASYIVEEYELVAQKLTAGTRLSPFVSPQDFSVPDFLLKPMAPEALPLAHLPHLAPATTASRQPQKRQPQEREGDGQSDRRAAILHFVLQNKGVSIKEICAIVPACSEKTVQRELAGLIGQGLIKREGERRWSVYKPA
jgi:hypothetical protein